MIELDRNPNEQPKLETMIKAIGIGGCGGNAINTMIQMGQENIEFWVVNTDVKDLQKSKAKNKLQIGKKITRGHGAGSDKEVGRKSAEESKEEIRQMLEGADMVFLVAGMGGGTGTGATPVVSAIAKEMNILTVGIVSSPFLFEGKKKIKQATSGIEKLREVIDTLVIVPNYKLQEIYGRESITEVFKLADKILFQGSKAISEIIQETGMINVDFADVRTVMQNRGYALMGIGIGEGDNRAQQAVDAAINNPLLADMELENAQGLLINVSAGRDFTMEEYSLINTQIIKKAGDEGDIINGLVINEDLEGKVKVTIIATGLMRSSSDMVQAISTQANVKLDEDIKDTFMHVKNEEKRSRNRKIVNDDIPSFIRRVTN